MIRRPGREKPKKKGRYSRQPGMAANTGSSYMPASDNAASPPGTDQAGNTSESGGNMMSGRDSDPKSDKQSGTQQELTSANVEGLLELNSDIIFRKLHINGRKDIPVTMAFIDGVVDTKAVDDDILKPLIQEDILSQCGSTSEVIDRIEHGVVYHASAKIRRTLPECVDDIIEGSVALIFDDDKTAVTFDIRGFHERSISEPTGENVIKGAKDSFVENLRTNTALVRMKVKNARLVIEEKRIGKQTATKIAVVYIKSLTNAPIVEELKKRLDRVDTEAVLTTGVIEEAIIDRKTSPFPQVITTERPDKFCSTIVEGRVGIIIDGMPVSIVVPGTFGALLQAPEDYSQNFIVSSIIRFMRYALMLVTLFLPGFYISVSSFHIEMIPTDLALAITASKEGVPFLTFIEVIFMLLAFEVLVEAGLRLPKTIGQAVSVVGAVVVGQAAVDARLVSPAVVVIIAITAISSFTMPNQDFSNALRLWRFIFAIFSSIIGLYGLSIGAIILLHHLSSIEVLGVPYLSPFVGGDGKNLQDAVFRFPFSMQKKRPMSLRTTNKRRRGSA
ncbi:MAG TPA: spore germination protein [Clostridiales bacterium]|nr:spore germination protein [Clostridiales bacterium]